MTILKFSGKCSGTNSSTIGYRFSASDEGLQELHSKPENDECTKGDSNTDVKTKPAMLTSGSLDGSKCEEEKNSIHGEAAKDYWGLLGRSISVDSTYESPFSNPIETWRKLNELKGKITKTVEEKISEMKMDRNVSSHSRLINSKENSSISDSEDTSESSKLSEQWKDAEDLNLSLKEVINKTTDMLSTTLDAALQNVKSEMEAEVELRNRKSHTKFSELMKIPDIKIATAKNDNDGNILDENLAEDIESGVEAQENLNSTLAEELDEPSYQISFGSSQTPPDGNDILSGFISSFTSIKLLEVSAVVFLFGFVLYVFLPMSDFSRGFLFCLLFVLIFMKLKNYLYEDEPSYLQQGSFVMPDFKSLPPLKVPQFKSVKGVSKYFSSRKNY